MVYRQIVKTGFYALIIMIMVSACTPDREASNIVSPELVARQFMIALFKEKDEAQLLALSAPAIADQIKIYTLSQYPRIVLNMAYGPDINLKSHSLSVNDGPVRGASSIAEILIVISGLYREQAKVDIRVVTLQKIDGQWRVIGIKEPDFDARERYGVDS